MKKMKNEKIRGLTKEDKDEIFLNLKADYLNRKYQE